MSKGIRNDTRAAVENRRENDTLALGPYLGALALRSEVTARLIAEMTGAHEQTVVRWFTQSMVQPQWALPVAKVVALLAWMYETEQEPLFGLNAERESQLKAYFKQFRELARSGARVRSNA